jgi:hypothetical protein
MSTKILLGMSEGKRPLGRPRHRLEDNIKVDVMETGVDRIHLAQDSDRWRALVNIVMSFMVPKKEGNFLSS